jgi:thiol-disulfide isomerase/thioredoxin/uncharacterized membrane protein YphA (DoxX/SURF4 family)
MDAALLIARLVLAGVFVLAGVAKLVDLEGSRKAVKEFGLPAGLASPLALLLPLAEIGVAVALIPASSAWLGALGALGLLLLFVVGISVNLARGRKPDCHCFGQLHSAPAGWKTLARNGVLAAVAGFVLLAGYYGGDAGPGALSWLGALSAAQVLGFLGGVLVLALLAAQWWFLIHLVQQNGRLLVRLEAVEESIGAGGSAGAPSQNGTPVRQEAEGLPVGSEAPQFSLSGLYGETLTLDALLRSSGKPLMMLFTDPGCGPCNALLPEVGRWQQEHANRLTLSLVSRGGVEENETKAQEHALENVVLQKDWEVSESYEVRGTPSAVLISPDGKVASPVAGGAEGIRGLLSYAVGERTQLPMLPHQPQGEGQPCPNCGKVHAAAPTVEAAQKLGEEAPEVKLADLEGTTVGLEDFKGHETLVLFWNPGCGFCQQMLPEIKQWEENRPQDTPGLLFVSAGSEDANREMGISSPVLLDQNFATGRAFGASGTPSAVLVDAEGRIASGVAVGAPAVLDLAGASRAES